MSGALRSAGRNGLRRVLGAKPASPWRNFAQDSRFEGVAPHESPKNWGTGVHSKPGLFLASAIGLGGLYYLFSDGLRSHRSQDSSSEPGSGKRPMTKRHPQEGSSGSEAFSPYPHQSPNQAAKSQTEASIPNKLAASSDTKGDTGGNADTRPDYRTGKGSGFAETNKEKGPNYKGKADE